MLSDNNTDIKRADVHKTRQSPRASDLKKSTLIPKSKCFPSRPPMLPPCRVCGDAASGFHYGVNTCEACKGFFRRSIIKSTPHVCIGSGTCKMFLGRRTSCSACRYKRCLDVGMSKHAIKTGRYTHELRSKNILEVKRLQEEKREEKPEEVAAKTFVTSCSTANGVDNCQTSCQSGFDWPNTDEYASVLDCLVEGQTCLFEDLDEYYDTDIMLQRQSAVLARYIEDNTVLLKNMQDPTEELKAQVLSTFMEDMKRSVKGMLEFAKIIPGFVDLPNEDQVVIVQGCRMDIWFLGHIRCFNSELQVGVCEWKFHAEELSKVWGEELVQMTFNLSRIGQSMDLNKEETAALRGFSVSLTDRGFELQDPAATERIHEIMLNVLKYTVLKRHKNFNQWFTKAIRFLTNIREISELFIQISSNLKLEWSVLENNPTLLEVFTS